MEKELKEIILEVIGDLKKINRGDAVIRWRYPDEPEFLCELAISKVTPEVTE